MLALLTWTWDYSLSKLNYPFFQVGDKLREMLLNEFSEQADLFSAEEKSELIFHLFKTLAVGGALCQPDSNIDR